MEKPLTLVIEEIIITRLRIGLCHGFLMPREPRSKCESYARRIDVHILTECLTYTASVKYQIAQILTDKQIENYPTS